ncbi:hypothetical protein YT1_4462 [Rhodococcus ruber]|nr:hypothetical protein YT1_4462 [Rhodococcus ruber]
MREHLARGRRKMRIRSLDRGQRGDSSVDLGWSSGLRVAASGGEGQGGVLQLFRRDDGQENLRR